MDQKNEFNQEETKAENIKTFSTVVTEALSNKDQPSFVELNYLKTSEGNLDKATAVLRTQEDLNVFVDQVASNDQFHMALYAEIVQVA